MAAGDWYYQVWEHTGQEERAAVLSTHKMECDADKQADMLNSKASNCARHGLPPMRFYFVQPVLEEHLREATAAHFRRCLSEDRERFMKHYDGYLLKVANEMLPYIINTIDNCHGADYYRLYYKGGWLEVYRGIINSGGMLKCYELFTGTDRVLLKLVGVNEEKVAELTVETFSSEEVLKAWLRNAPVAGAAIEDKMIDLFCDRYGFKG